MVQMSYVLIQNVCYTRLSIYNAYKVHQYVLF